VFVANDMPQLWDPSRIKQTFPVLNEADMVRFGRFGEARRFAPGEHLVRAGVPSPGVFLLNRGTIEIRQRDGLGHVAPLRRVERGEFLGEVGGLSGAQALVDAVALEEVETMLVAPERLRALIIAEAELGERVMRALILRRVALIQEGRTGATLIGRTGSADVLRLQNFLRRNGEPHQVVTGGDDPLAAALLEQYGAAPDDAIAVAPNGTVLVNPTEQEIARALGMLPDTICEGTYDVIVVGAGPAGLATAVYAASEGLSVIVVDCRSFGGQAGASARIENYLGFPTGISGQALAGRAFVQAQKFGAEIIIPAEAKRLDCSRAESEGRFAVQLTDGRCVHSRCVVIASGARYRRPALPRIADFEGRGIFFWASALEARMCAEADVVLVGGGNSAGQAAVFLSAHAKRVHMLVRGPGLAASMSRYLIDRIEATPNIELLTETELVALDGCPANGLRQVRWRCARTGEEEQRDLRHVFLFVGADPETAWLEDCGVAVDKHGFVLTGPEAARPADGDGRAARIPAPFETSVPGAFAIGDVRAGSVKRVGGAIGDGAAVVAQIHHHLAEMEPPRSLRSLPPEGAGRFGSGGA
jgi:thioredoxin reductase (NADPH)